MTVSNTTVRAKYTGDGANDTFAIPSAIQANSQIAVYVRDTTDDPSSQALQTEGSGNDYTITGGDPGTNVVFTAGSIPAATDEVVVIRVTPKTQAQDYAEGDGFPEDAHENALDKNLMLIQEACEKLGRALLFPISSDSSDIGLPDLIADNLLKVNSAGTGLEWSTEIDVPIISTETIASGAAVAAFSASVRRQIWRIQGTPGAVQASATPFGSTAPANGSRFELIGLDDTATVTIINNDAAKGCLLNGNAVLKKWYKINFYYDLLLDRYLEESRNF